MEKKKLVIISGARRGIGKSFFNHYKKQYEIIGISKTSSKGYTKLDLLNENKTFKMVKDLTLRNVNEIIYLHSIGIDKFEQHGLPHIDFDGDGIDDEVYGTNVSAFLNLAQPLIDRIKKQNIKMTMVNIGSISDFFEVPYWQSFTKSKNIVRKFCKILGYSNLTSLILNVSSTLDEQGNTFGRINADTTYWQTSKELVDRSHKLIDIAQELGSNYGEHDFYKHNPIYRPDHFTNHPRLLNIWKHDLGFEGKEVPLGIRI